MTYEYLAGFFDGEGSISIIRDGIDCRTKVCITNTNEKVMAAIATFISHTYNKKSGPLGTSQAFTLEICDQAAILIILNGMMPYLIVKKPRAEMMIEYLNGIGKRTYHLTSEIRKARIEFAEKFCYIH